MKYPYLKANYTKMKPYTKIWILVIFLAGIPFNFISDKFL